jgi:hypothetical protein
VKTAAEPEPEDRPVKAAEPEDHPGTRGATAVDLPETAADLPEMAVVPAAAVAEVLKMASSVR